jgi:hypothetical protein
MAIFYGSKNSWKYCSMFNPHYPQKIKLSQIYEHDCTIGETHKGDLFKCDFKRCFVHYLYLKNSRDPRKKTSICHTQRAAHLDIEHKSHCQIYVDPTNTCIFIIMCQFIELNFNAR